MPNNRIGFGTDFNLKNEQIGIGLTNQSARLHVAGIIRAEKLITTGSGINTFYGYDGFLNDKQETIYDQTINITNKGNLNSISGEIVLQDEFTVTDGTPLTGGRLDSLTVTGTFDLPHGGTLDREETPEKGSTRFNQDLGQLEFYTGVEWRTVGSYDGSGRGRGVFAGGSLSTPTYISTIQYINITTTGNSQYFGERAGDSTTSGEAQGCSSSVRGIFGGGVTPSNSNIIDYITIASQGNSINFGDLTLSRNALGSCSSSTRGVWGGGINPAATPTIFVNTIDYVQISTIGDAIDFGDLSVSRFGLSCAGSPTRGVFVSGAQVPSPVNFGLETIDFITISSKGTAVNFGNINQGRTSSSGCSSSVRGIFAGGYNPAPSVAPTTLKSSIEYITFSSTGSSIIFGDLTLARSYLASASTQIRGVWGGGIAASPSPSNRTNIIDYVLIASTGNAQDFGDLSQPTGQIAACSDSHGGLGGF